MIDCKFQGTSWPKICMSGPMGERTFGKRPTVPRGRERLIRECIQRHDWLTTTTNFQLAVILVSSYFFSQTSRPTEFLNWPYNRNFLSDFANITQPSPVL